MEDAFIAAILESPCDPSPRLVYADWLEERGDPRAEFLRIELTLFDLSQREAHVALKARMRELLPALHPEWVALVRLLPLDPLDELRMVLPPPKRLLHATGNWAEVEETLGLTLPSDYKAFISSYGSGTAGCIEILSPFGFTPDVRDRWVTWAGLIVDLAEYEEVPYPVFPQAGGLLPFGTLGDVDLLTWRTLGDSENWPFVYHHQRQGFFEIKGLSAVEFLLEAVMQRSPLMIHLDREKAFDRPCEFQAFMADPCFMEFVRHGQLDLDAITERFARRWPNEQVAIRRSEGGVSLRIDPLAGGIALYDDGDEPTFARIYYDRRYASGAQEAIQSLLAEGFTEITRS
jgi:uncharacterized protein (TIGR02996 family)